MQIAQIGNWEFELPEGWVRKENESSNSYFEAPNGSQGLYVKTINPRDQEETPEEFAISVQSIHSRAFAGETESRWEIVDQRMSADDDLARSVLDLYDNGASYRVLSLVVSSRQSAIQVTVHDYLCESYNRCQAAFADLESSIAWVPDAAQLCVQADRR